jgi:hypothetical protein
MGGTIDRPRAGRLAAPPRSIAGDRELTGVGGGWFPNASILARACAGAKARTPPIAEPRTKTTFLYK